MICIRCDAGLCCCYLCLCTLWNLSLDISILVAAADSYFLFFAAAAANTRSFNKSLWVEDESPVKFQWHTFSNPFGYTAECVCDSRLDDKLSLSRSIIATSYHHYHLHFIIIIAYHLFSSNCTVKLNMCGGLIVDSMGEDVHYVLCKLILFYENVYQNDKKDFQAFY